MTNLKIILNNFGKMFEYTTRKRHDKLKFDFYIFAASIKQYCKPMCIIIPREYNLIQMYNIHSHIYT